MWRPIIQWRGRYMASYNPVEKVVTCHHDIPVVNYCIFRNRLGTQHRAVDNPLIVSY